MHIAYITNLINKQITTRKKLTNLQQVHKEKHGNLFTDTA